jgi:hypothetical protein
MTLQKSLSSEMTFQPGRSEHARRFDADTAASHL